MAVDPRGPNRRPPFLGRRESARLFCASPCGCVERRAKSLLRAQRQSKTSGFTSPARCAVPNAPAFVLPEDFSSVHSVLALMPLSATRSPRANQIECSGQGGGPGSDCGSGHGFFHKPRIQEP